MFIFIVLLCCSQTLGLVTLQKVSNLGVRVKINISYNFQASEYEDKYIKMDILHRDEQLYIQAVPSALHTAYNQMSGVILQQKAGPIDSDLKEQLVPIYEKYANIFAILMIAYALKDLSDDINKAQNQDTFKIELYGTIYNKVINIFNEYRKPIKWVQTSYFTNVASKEYIDIKNSTIKSLSEDIQRMEKRFLDVINKLHTIRKEKGPIIISL